MVKAPVRKKGYTARYMKHQLDKNRTTLLLGLVFLVGVAVGGRLASQELTILDSLTAFLSQTKGSSGFVSGVMTTFATNAALLLLICLCGFGAIFQPLVLTVLLFKGLGFGVLGVYAYSSGDRGAIMYYLLVLLPEAVLTVLILVTAAKESLRFSARFLAELLPHREGTEQSSPTGSGVGIYLARFVVFYLLNGSAALLVGILKLLFQSLV